MSGRIAITEKDTRVVNNGLTFILIAAGALVAGECIELYQRECIDTRLMRMEGHAKTANGLLARMAVEIAPSENYKTEMEKIRSLRSAIDKLD